MGNLHVTYYAEHKDDRPETWSSPRPDFDLERFQRELTRRTGTVNGLACFRCRWAGDKEEYVIEDDLTVLTGWNLFENGESAFVSCLNGDAVVPPTAIASPVYESYKVFIPRFVVEELREGVYHKAWVVEGLEEIGGENGRINALSHYREPSEIDLKMAVHLRYLRDTLTEDDIAKGLEREAAALERQKNASREEFIDECAEDFARAITDGIDAPEHDFTKQFEPNYINTYSRALVEAHNL